MKYPFFEKIICRDNGRVLLSVKKTVTIGQNTIIKTNYEIWNNIAKYELGIASEMLNNAYYVYMFTIDAQNERAAIQIFFSIK